MLGSYKDPRKEFGSFASAFLQTTRKKITSPILTRILRILINANFLGLPWKRSLAKGITQRVSRATIRMIQLIHSGFCGISRNVAISSVYNNRIADKMMVVNKIDVEEVL